MKSSLVPPAPGSTAVPTYLPLGFIAAGIISFLWIAVQFVAALPDAVVYVRHNKVLLVLVHLFTLTWGSGVTLGVLHQMTPVIVSAKLYSVRMGWISLALFVPGSLLLASSFRSFWLLGVATGGVIVLAGTFVFALNMVRTLQSSRQRGVTHRYLIASTVAFLGTLLAGLAMAIALRFGSGINVVDPILAIHLLLGAMGWFTGMIIGVSYQLFPMFLLVHGHDERPAKLIFIKLYTGILLGMIGAIWASEAAFIVPGVALIAVAMTLYAKDFLRMWKACGRKPDIWMRQTRWAVFYGVIATYGVLAALAWGNAGLVPARIMLALGLLFGMGWISTLIVALLHKIVPFLVWYYRYGDLVGRQQVPVMSDLTNERLGVLVFPIYHTTLLLTTVFVALGHVGWARISAVGFALTCILLVLDLLILVVPMQSFPAKIKKGFVSTGSGEAVGE